MKKLLLEGTPARDAGGRMTTPPRELFSREEYCDMVQKAQAHIYNGDIFQVVLAQRLATQNAYVQVAHAILTYVAIDDEGRPRPVAPAAVH